MIRQKKTQLQLGTFILYRKKNFVFFQSIKLRYVCQIVFCKSLILVLSFFMLKIKLPVILFILILNNSLNSQEFSNFFKFVSNCLNSIHSVEEIKEGIEISGATILKKNTAPKQLLPIIKNLDIFGYQGWQFVSKEEKDFIILSLGQNKEKGKNFTICTVMSAVEDYKSNSSLLKKTYDTKLVDTLKKGPQKEMMYEVRSGTVDYMVVNITELTGKKTGLLKYDVIGEY